MSLNHILYHSGCLDGFTSAWITHGALTNTTGVKSYLDDRSYENPNYIQGSRVQLLAVRHGEAPPTFTSNSNLYLVDFCYDKDILSNLAKKHSKVVVIDHHETTKLNVVDNVEYCVATDVSTSYLSWSYWFPSVEPPVLVKYINDYDMWRNALPYSKEVTAYIDGYYKNIGNWNYLCDLLEKDVIQVGALGSEMLKAKNSAVCDLLDNVRFESIGDYKVPVVNSPLFQSEVCYSMLEMYPKAPFSACYWDDHKGQRHWSLRSDKVDVLSIATAYGGGGHRCAAGYMETL